MERWRGTYLENFVDCLKDAPNDMRRNQVRRWAQPCVQKPSCSGSERRRAQAPPAWASAYARVRRRSSVTSIGAVWSCRSDWTKRWPAGALSWRMLSRPAPRR
jgi:hypothetical protein